MDQRTQNVLWKAVSKIKSAHIWRARLYELNSSITPVANMLTTKNNSVLH